MGKPADDAAFVPTEVQTKATAALQEEVQKDLDQPDPSPDKAKAILLKDNPREAS